MYPNQANSGIVGATKVAEIPVLFDSCKRIHTRISNAHDAATRIENALDRLMNPTPRPAAEGSPQPTPQTVESHLHLVDSNIEGLVNRLQELAGRLDRAA